MLWKDISAETAISIQIYLQIKQKFASKNIHSLFFLIIIISPKIQKS